MRWLLRALSSTLGQKYVIGITGLLLSGFLVVHLAGNLLLYAGVDVYNDYAIALHEQELLLRAAEVGLYALFLAHIALAIITTRDNWRARKSPYARKETKQEGKILMFQPSNWMFVTGAIVLGFLILHVGEFTFHMRLRGPEGELPFDRAVRILRDPISMPVYIIGSLALGVHLGHGVASAFQTLGLNHPKYNALITWLGVIFAIVIALGFASFPIWALTVAETVQ